MVFDGQSQNNVPDGCDSYPFQTMSALGVPWANTAINGTSFTVLATTQADRLGCVARQADRSILVLAGGFADIMSEGNSGAQAYEDMVAYARSARRLGFTHVVGTTLPDTSIYDADQYARRDDFNARVLASGEWEAVADFAAVPELQYHPGSPAFGPDEVHWSPVGAMHAAAVVRPALVGLLGV